MNPDAIVIEVDGATFEEIDRGVAAALAVFAAGGTTAREAADAAFHQACLDDGGYYDGSGNFRDPHEGIPLDKNEIRWGKMTEREGQVAELWRVADAAAVEACCAGWPAERIPQSAYLSLLREPVDEHATTGGDDAD
jgi:hypothetical protein